MNIVRGVSVEGSIGVVSVDRSVRQPVDPVRRVVHGPGVSVFGLPIQDRFWKSRPLFCRKNMNSRNKFSNIKSLQ